MQGDGVARPFHHRDRIGEMAEALPLIQTWVRSLVDGDDASGCAATQDAVIRQPELAEVVAVDDILRTQPDRAHLTGDAWDAGQDFNGVQKTGSGAMEHQVQKAILGRGDIFKYLVGRDVRATGIRDYVDVRNRQAVDGDTDAAHGLIHDGGFGEMKMELPDSGVQRDVIDELTLAAVLKQLGISRA